MLYNAKSGQVKFPETEMEYVCFGSGSQVLVMLPGLGDGLRTVKGTAIPVAWMYRIFAKDYTVYMFSRKKVLPEGCTTADMARDLKLAMDALGIEKAHVFAVSMGGMIAQHLAADYPEKVGKLVLTVTAARPNALLLESVEEWVSCARQGDHAALMDSNLKRIYSEKYYRSNKWMIPLIGVLTRPKSYERFFVQAEACKNHDAFDKLPGITAPTLVIGGEQDNCLGGDPSREIAEKIPGATLKMYGQWGHGVYEEEKEFNAAVKDFLGE